jgi:AcrR family transcriptional regulator
MDRRQRKTREAIFKAFIFLLSKKNFNSVTVGEIIELADVGRATFYAHFETKDFLLKELCAELFDHIFCAETECDGGHNLFHCDEKDSVFLHLFRHIQKNDNNIAKLLSSANNELFLEYFKNGVKGLVTQHIQEFSCRKPQIVPQDFWINHVTTTFIETLKWWLEKEMEQPPEMIAEYFLQSV